jgi:hypothetical protein
MRLLNIRVNKHQHDVLFFVRSATIHIDGRLVRTQSADERSVKKAGMLAEQSIQRRELGHDIFFVFPR